LLGPTSDIEGKHELSLPPVANGTLASFGSRPNPRLRERV